MLIKTKEGIFKEKYNISEEDSVKPISIDDICIIQNFFNEEFFGVFDRDTFSLINTNIRIN